MRVFWRDHLIDQQWPTVAWLLLTYLAVSIVLMITQYSVNIKRIDRQTDRYFIDRKKVNPDLFVIEIEICTCIYNIVNLLKSYDNIHSMTYITKIMLTGIAIRNTGYILKIRLKGIARVT